MQGLLKRFRKKKSYTAAWPLCDEETATRPEINPQRQSPLTNKLSTEIRLMIYDAVLVNRHRFLHICQNTALKKVRKVAHFWCVDIESPFPTWQHHNCYGEGTKIVPAGRAFRWRPITETHDKMLSLLLVCRIIYSEALPVLYQENTFHFRGSAGLLAFTSTLPMAQWDAIRRVHISAFFNHTWSLRHEDGFFLPDNIWKWQQCCERLTHLRRLAFLTLDLTIRIGNKWDIADEAEQRVLGAVLAPLGRISVRLFEVEVNVEPPTEVWMSSRQIGYSIKHVEREYNRAIYSSCDVRLGVF